MLTVLGMLQPAEVQVEIIRSGQEWADLRDQWDTLLTESVFPSVFLSFDYLHSAYNAFHTRHSEPFILTLKNNEGVLLGVTPFRRSVRRQGGVNLNVLESPLPWLPSGCLQ
jgi:hypothetical protein